MTKLEDDNAFCTAGWRVLVCSSLCAYRACACSGECLSVIYRSIGASRRLPHMERSSIVGQMASSVGTIRPGSCDAVAVGFAGDMLNVVAGQHRPPLTRHARDVMCPVPTISPSTLALHEYFFGILGQFRSYLATYSTRFRSPSTKMCEPYRVVPR